MARTVWGSDNIRSNNRSFFSRDLILRTGGKLNYGQGAPLRNQTNHWMDCCRSTGW